MYSKQLPTFALAACLAAAVPLLAVSSAQADTLLVVVDGCSSCCVANGALGCDDPACEAIVCGVDPYCCETEWDGICADEAVNLCGQTCSTVCSIQAAIDAAVDADEIIVAPGTYFESAINFLGKAITVRSADGAGVTTVDGGGMDRVFICNSGEGPATVLDGFTITGGSASTGAGMLISGTFGSNPTVTNCTFTGNSASNSGGGMYIANGSSPMVTDCTFSTNSATTFGGGMYNDFLGSSPTVTNCTFSGNTALQGGGMYNSTGGTATVTNCTFTANSAPNGGGGMYNTLASPMVSHCVFDDNTSTGGTGGGMFNGSSTPTVTDCVFSLNFALTGGGMNNAFDSPTVTNCVFISNTADSVGGGMNNLNCNPPVTNCTFRGNWADVGGGGMYSGGSSPVLTNCTFSGNSTIQHFGDGMYSQSGTTTVANCIFWDNGPTEIGGDAVVNFSDIKGGWGGAGSGNIDADPNYVNAIGGDLHLSSGSPCIDSADNTAVPVGLDTDLDGNPRFVDDPDTRDTGNPDGVNPIVDMGTYEFQVVSPCPWDLDGSGDVGINDFLGLLAQWGTDPGGPPDFDGSGDVGINDFLALLANWGACP